MRMVAGCESAEEFERRMSTASAGKKRRWRYVIISLNGQIKFQHTKDTAAHAAPTCHLIDDTNLKAWLYFAWNYAGVFCTRFSSNVYTS